MWYTKAVRSRYRRRTHGSALARCWASSTPLLSQPWLETEFLAIDTETSALSPAEGELLSIGWVLIQGGRVITRSAEHHLITNRRGVGQSAVIHQLRDCELVGGLGHDQMMQRLLEVAAGRLLLFHYAPLDLAFLNQVSRELYGAPLLLPYIDTLEIERQKMDRRGKTPQRGNLRLTGCRHRYHLPDYPAHNALVDALATAELFIAQARYRGEETQLRTKDICR